MTSQRTKKKQKQKMIKSTIKKDIEIVWAEQAVVFLIAGDCVFFFLILHLGFVRVIFLVLFGCVVAFLFGFF